MGGSRAILVDVRPGAVSRPLWAALRAAAGPATITELHVASHAHPNAIDLRLRRWVRAGFVNEVRGRPHKFAMSSSASDMFTPPPIGTAGKPGPIRHTRQRLWDAMRVLKTFDVPLLELTAEASRRSCEDFLNLLQRAGYVRILNHPVAARPAPPPAPLGQGRGRSGASNAGIAVARDWSTYQLVRATGPKAPIITNPAGGAPRELVDLNKNLRLPLGPGLRAARRQEASARRAGRGRS